MPEEVTVVRSAFTTKLVPISEAVVTATPPTSRKIGTEGESMLTAGVAHLSRLVMPSRTSAGGWLRPKLLLAAV